MHLLHSPYKNVERMRASPHRERDFNGLAVVTVKTLNSYEEKSLCGERI